MSTQQDEQLSALIDGELDDTSRDIIINKLCNNEDDKQCWHRYHMISDALRSKLPEAIDPEFSKRVMSSIADEPAIIAPKAIQSDKSSTSQKPHTTITKRITGAAIAASVAVVAILSVQMNNQTEPVPQLAEMPSSNEFVRMAKQPQPVSSQVIARQQGPSSAMNVASTSSRTISRSVEKIDPLLHQYIMNHSQRVSGGQLQGVIPYARIVVTPIIKQGQVEK